MLAIPGALCKGNGTKALNAVRDESRLWIVSVRVLLRLVLFVVVFHSAQHFLFAEFDTLALMYGQSSSDFIVQEPPYIWVNSSMSTCQGHPTSCSKNMSIKSSVLSVQIQTWSRCLCMAVPPAVILWPAKILTNPYLAPQKASWIFRLETGSFSLSLSDSPAAFRAQLKWTWLN